MFATRLVRSFARQSLNQYIASPSLLQSCHPPSPAISRPLCVPRAAQGASPSPAADSTKGHKSPDPSSQQSDATPIKHQPQKPSSEPEKDTVKKDPVPDIPSTAWSSIGFEEQDAKDPNKWKKFAWKYAGAVLLFMISYKTLHWYTDRLEADGKRKRKEMEEDREIADQIRSTDPQAERFPFLEPLKDAPKLPETSSELDELYAYKAQLETNLQTLRAQGRSPEIRTQTKEAEAELRDLADDIRLLEIKKAAS